MFDAHDVRKDFPQLKRKINGKPMIYLDSTATVLKPQSVLDKMNEYYTQYTANVFRGIYTTSEEATLAFEKAREKVARFINAPSTEEIVFTRSTTESINLVAYSWVLPFFEKGDEIVTTIMEHHSNFVPWQQLALEKKLEFRIWKLDKNYSLNLNELDKLITRRTKLLAITAVSNVLGTINPMKKIVSAVKRLNPHCAVLVDAAQAAPHMKIDVNDWGADIVAFSGHKMLGPTGVGVLWARKELLEEMKPFNYGGEMISEVHVDRTVFKESPHKFEAGTPHIAGVIGLGAAIDYLDKLGMENVRHHEMEITAYVLRQLERLPYVNVIGPRDPKDRGGVIAFTMKGVHSHDIAQLLNEDNVCVRAGNHCAMPLHEYLGIASTARASFYVYTTKEDIDALIKGLEKIKKLFA